MGLHPAEQSWQEFVTAGSRYVLEGTMLEQARLPARDGGLGISSACDTAQAAYVASTLQALPPVLSAWAGVLLADPEAAAAAAAAAGLGGGAPAAAAAALDAAPGAGGGVALAPAVGGGAAAAVWQQRGGRTLQRQQQQQQQALGSD